MEGTPEDREAVRAALAEIIQPEDVARAAWYLGVDATKTSALIEKLKGFDLGKRPLIVTEDASEHLYLSARNLPYVEVRDVQGLDPAALVGADSVLITADAIKKIEEWLA